MDAVDTYRGKVRGRARQGWALPTDGRISAPRTPVGGGLVDFTVLVASCAALAMRGPGSSSGRSAAPASWRYIRRAKAFLEASSEPSQEPGLTATSTVTCAPGPSATASTRSFRNGCAVTSGSWCSARTTTTLCWELAMRCARTGASAEVQCVSFATARRLLEADDRDTIVSCAARGNRSSLCGSGPHG